MELLGVGDYPDPTGSDERPISVEQWEACTQEDAAVVGDVYVAFDVSPERRTSMAVAGKTYDGFWCVEVFEKRERHELGGADDSKSSSTTTPR